MPSNCLCPREVPLAYCTFGRNVLVNSDHKPLELILKKPAASAPQRLQGMMMRLQRYDITVGYERARICSWADLLSRAYLTKEEPEGEVCEHGKLCTNFRRETQRDQTRNSKG